MHKSSSSCVQIIWGIKVTEIKVGKKSNQASVLDTVEVLHLDTVEVPLALILQYT